VLVPTKVKIRKRDGSTETGYYCMRVNLRLSGVDAAELSTEEGKRVAEYVSKLVQTSVDAAFELDEREPVP